jgi:hypothetical protein
LLALELAAERISGGGEQANALIRNVLAPAFYQLLIAIADRMRHHENGKAGMPYALGDYLREGRERGADHRNSGDTEVFEYDRVTRGPGG